MPAFPRLALLASLLAATLSLPALADQAVTSPTGVTTVTLAQQAPIH
ncbi:hypothetical protein [Aeromonas bestiarum]